MATTAQPVHRTRAAAHLPYPYPVARRVLEPLAVAAGLLLLALFCPLNHPYFWGPAAAVCVGTVVYAAHAARTVPGAARRWGLTRDAAPPGVWARGLVWSAAVIGAWAVPILFVRWLVARGDVALPPLHFPPGYVAWCVVQDFLFFALVLRNLLDVANRHAAVWAAAALFGASHYPFGFFMVVTVPVAACWGYVYAATRVLWFVVLLHAVQGLMILWR